MTSRVMFSFPLACQPQKCFKETWEAVQGDANQLIASSQLAVSWIPCMNKVKVAWRLLGIQPLPRCSPGNKADRWRRLEAQLWHALHEEIILDYRGAFEHILDNAGSFIVDLGEPDPRISVRLLTKSAKMIDTKLSHHKIAKSPISYKHNNIYRSNKIQTMK